MKNDKTRTITGLIVFALGIILCLYVSLWIMMIQPIMACCNAFDADTLTGAMIGRTILSVIFSGTVGSCVYIFFQTIAMKIIGINSKRKNKYGRK